MKSASFVFGLAWRDTRATWRRLLLLTATVTAGVGALVAINSFTDNLRVSVAEQAQALLGADLSLRAREPIDTMAVANRLADSLAGAGAEVARSVSFSGMAYLPRAGTARFVQVTSVDRGWPYYGTMKTSPAGIWERLQQGEMIVDPSLLPTLDAAVGDTVALGEARYRIAGTVVDVPGAIGLESSFGARVFIGHRTVPSTGLLGFGARVEYETYFRLPPEADAQRIAADYRRELRESRLRVRTIADERDDLTQDLTRLGSYLGLAALAALLLGGLGTASAVNVLVRQRLPSIAILRCLGATSRQVLAVFLIQAVAMGLLGAILGAVIGVALQQLLPTVFAGLLPVDVRVLPSPGAIALGISLGTWTAMVFALLPLLAVRGVSPLATLRRQTELPPATRDAARIMALLLLAASVVVLATMQVGSFASGIAFSVAVAAALAALWIASAVVIRLARMLTRSPLPYLPRQGLANLHRPGNQTVTVVVALGFGAFLLTTLYVAQVNLLRPFRIDPVGGRPNMALFDIQTDQVETVRNTVNELGGMPGEFVPMVSMRLLEVNGTVVREMLGRGGAVRPADSAAGPDGRASGWALRREYRSTYRAGPGPSERVTTGRWFDEGPSGSGRSADDPVALSLEIDLASELLVGIGDTIVWDVQGIPIHSVVTSLREVNWARMEPNFFAVFAPGALEQAPQSWITLVRIEDPSARGMLQRRLAERTSNVTSIDLGQIQAALEEVIGRVVLAVRFMALFSLATGTVVLVGAISTSRWQRLRESTLLRTLGATRGQVLVILAVEYAVLGIAAALVAGLLSGVAGWALARWVFDAAFVLPVGPISMLAAAMAALTTAVGLWNSAGLLRRPPLEVLRSD